VTAVLQTLHDRICKAEGCVLPMWAGGKAEGLCTQHYQDRLKELAYSPQKNISRKGPCLAGNCDKPRRSRGLCEAHYAYSIRRLDNCPACGTAKDRRSALCGPCHTAAVTVQAPTEKMCWMCRQTLPISAFRLRKSSQGSAKWRSRCTDCEAADSRLQAKNALRHHTQDRASKSYAGLRQYAKKLGIPWAEVVERYPPDNRCEVCRRTPQEANQGGRYARLSLDHCHQTGQLRGFLCGPCNSGVGHLGDTPSRLRAALKYLNTAERRINLAQDPGEQEQIPGLWE
jgi:hypothetical protein